MSSKWREFHSQYSPVEVGTVNTGDRNPPGDWFRLANEDALINGVPVKDYREKYNNFATENDVKQFFKEVILKDVKNGLFDDVKKIFMKVDDLDKDKAAEYLLTVFHQGGLMYPVSSPMSVMLSDNGLQEVHTRKDNRKISITTTEHGFKIQEIYTIDKVMFTPTTIYPDYSAEEKQQLQVKQAKQNIIQPGFDKDAFDPIFVDPDPGNPYIIEASATIDVDFSNKKTDSPDISVESNYISYGHEGVKSVLDKRNFVQVIVDYLRNIFGSNSVKEMSKIEANVTPEEPDVKGPTA